MEDPSASSAYNLAGSGAEPVPKAERILRDRARQYAKPLSQLAGGPEIEVLLFRLGEDRYAVELRSLRAVQHAHGLTPVPCTPPHVAGILNVRGEVVAVLDLAAALGLAGSPKVSGRGQVMLVELPRLQVGLLVEEVLGVHRLLPDKLDRSLSGSEFTRGIAEGTTVLLNLEQLLSSERFEVLEEVS